jgi:hypothetical protein
MNDVFNWHSPSSRLVLNGVLDTLAELGYDGLTVTEIKARAGAAGSALGDSPDLDSLVIAALGHVELFPPPVVSGNLRQDLRALLGPWRTSPGRDERVIAALLSAAIRRPRLRVAVHEALDRPLTHSVAAVISRASSAGEVPSRVIQTLCWVLRGLIVDRLRSAPRSPVDIDLLVEFLMAGLRVDLADSPAPANLRSPSTATRSQAAPA